MSEDSTIQVTFGAQIQGLLDGMGKAQSSVKEATEGMSGSIAKMAETMATLGPAALALAAVGIAFEAIKSTVEYVNESVEKTKELAETFRTLSYATGASNEELNQYTAAMEMSGGSVDNVTSLMQGMVRAVKTNADGLVANGMAADKAGLQHMSFGEYLKKASEIADNMKTPLERDEFLTLALGRAGAKCGAQLHEMVENMEKVSKTQILDPNTEALMKSLTEAEGRLKTAQEALAAQTAAMAAPAKIAWDNMKASALESTTAQNATIEAVKKGYIQNIWAANDMGDHVTRNWAAMDEAARKYYEQVAKNGSSDWDAGTHRDSDAKKQDYVKTKNDGGGDDPATPKAAKDPMSGWEQELATQKAKLIQANGDMAEISAEDEREFWAAKVALAQKGSKEWEQAVTKMAEAGRKANSQRVSEDKAIQGQLDAIDKEQADAAKQAAQEALAAARTAAKQQVDLAKEGAREQQDAAKDALAEQHADLDQKVALGQISAAQEIAQRKALVAQELALDLQAKDQEIAAEKAGPNDPVKLQQFANQKLDITRRSNAQIADLNRKAAQDQMNTYHQVFQGMTSGFSSSISGLIKGTMSWGDAIRNVASSALDSMVNFFVQMGLKAAETWLASQIMAQTSNTTEAASSAALYGVNAMASAAAIPVYGWAMAPWVGAEAYAAGLAMAGLASAAGGWDQVPSDQLAQIHKNEMVLSAPVAQWVRQASGVGQGSGGASQTHNHFNFNGVTDTSWWRANQGNILKQFSDATHNRRKA